VVNFEQILFANGRMLNLTEAPAQGGRAIQFDFLTGTHPGVRGLAPKHVGRKEIPCKYLQCCKANR
jgi:hypothetical protein